MKSSPPQGLTLDAGALIALESGRQRIRDILSRAASNQWPIAVPAGVIAQVWRGGPRQARIVRLLADPRVEIVALDGIVARAVGLLAIQTEHFDVVDVSVALCAAERKHAVVTSDPGDIAGIDPTLHLLTP